MDRLSLRFSNERSGAHSSSTGQAGKFARKASCCNAHVFNAHRSATRNSVCASWICVRDTVAAQRLTSTAGLLAECVCVRNFHVSLNVRGLSRESHLKPQKRDFNFAESRASGELIDRRSVWSQVAERTLFRALRRIRCCLQQRTLENFCEFMGSL